MSFSSIFDQPLFHWDHARDDDGLASRFWQLPRVQDENGRAAFMPPCDISETADGYVVKLELPGMKKDDIHINLKDGILSVEAESSEEKEEKEGDRVLRRERRYGKYVRRFNVGADVGSGDGGVKVEFKDGVLSLNIARPNSVAEESVSISID
jgi:HSP20 family protein